MGKIAGCGSRLRRINSVHMLNQEQYWKWIDPVSVYSEETLLDPVPEVEKSMRWKRREKAFGERMVIHTPREVVSKGSGGWR